MAAAQQGLRDRVAASAAPGGPTFDLAAETEEVRTQFEAVVRLGARADAVESHDPRDGEIETEPTDDDARALLQSLGRKATEEGARQLLVQIGLWSEHENLGARRSTRSRHLEPAQAVSAQCLCHTE